VTVEDQGCEEFTIARHHLFEHTADEYVNDNWDNPPGFNLDNNPLNVPDLRQQILSYVDATDAEWPDTSGAGWLCFDPFENFGGVESDAVKARMATALDRAAHLSQLVLIAALGFEPPAAGGFVTPINSPDSYSCQEYGNIAFENLPDGTRMNNASITGVQFSTTDGFTWLVGDFSTGQYNGKYPSGEYTSQDDHWAWLGTEQGRGRLDFPNGPASYISLLVSAFSPVTLDAYGEDGQLLESAGPSRSNINTGTMDELRIQRLTADIHHVIVHDSGNYFLVDSICTDAPGAVPFWRETMQATFEGLTDAKMDVGTGLLEIMETAGPYLTAVQNYQCLHPFPGHRANSGFRGRLFGRDCGCHQRQSGG
jgi:hypothetical protein